MRLLAKAAAGTATIKISRSINNVNGTLNIWPLDFSNVFFSLVIFIIVAQMLDDWLTYIICYVEFSTTILKHEYMNSVTTVQKRKPIKNGLTIFIHVNIGITFCFCAFFTHQNQASLGTMFAIKMGFSHLSLPFFDEFQFLCVHSHELHFFFQHYL